MNPGQKQAVIPISFNFKMYKFYRFTMFVQIVANIADFSWNFHFIAGL